MTQLMKDCIASWKINCPDYQVIEWNEDNFDIESNIWVKEAISAGNWSLASDIMRAWILFEHGGIYVDTDVEILKPLDDMLDNDFFIGYESKHWVNTAIIGSVKEHEILKWIKERYESVAPKIDEHSNLLAVQAYSCAIELLYKVVPNGKTAIMNNGVALYAKEYFYPQHYLSHKIEITDNSYTIHRCSSTWHSKRHKRLIRFFRAVRRLIGGIIFGFFEGRAAKKYRKILTKERQKHESNTGQQQSKKRRLHTNRA